MRRSRFLGLWAAAALACAAAAMAGERELSRFEQRYFVPPREPARRAAFLKRWRRKLLAAAVCDSRDAPAGDQTERHLLVRLVVKNRSKWVADFTSASGPAAALGRVGPGKTASALVLDVVTATLREEDGVTYYRYKRTNPRAEVSFRMLAKSGRALALRWIIEAPIQADGARSSTVGRPKSPRAAVRLELGPQDESAGSAAETVRTKRIKADEDLLDVRRRWGDANRKLGTNLKEFVSPHFVVYTDFADGKGMAKGCETVYRRLRKVFGLKRTTKLWKGRCVIFLFAAREDFLRFAEVFDRFAEARVTAGYFSRRGRLHIAVPRSTLSEGAERSLRSTVVHEMGHAFLEAYCGEGRAPSWLHEGVAQTCEQILDPRNPKLERHRQRVKEWAEADAAPRTFRQMAAMSHIVGSDIDSYAMAYSMVEWMVRMQPKKFRKLLELTRRGAAPEQAIETAFGASLSRLESAWRRYVLARY